MASTKLCRDYILEQLNMLNNVTYRPMMGEYLLYYNNVLFGGIYDNRLLIKKVDNNKKYNLTEVIPYDGSKTMYLINDIENRKLLSDIVIDTYETMKKGL